MGINVILSLCEMVFVDPVEVRCRFCSALIAAEVKR